MRILSLLLLGLSLHGMLAAAPVDREAALRIARTWWTGMQVTQHDGRSSDDIQLAAVYSRGYLFTHRESFVVVAADDADPQILGYGTRRHEAQMPPVLRAVLNRPGGGGHPYPAPGADWHAVAPLLSTVRHQEDPYNRACPYYKDAQGHLSVMRCKVGCVATAVEQILTYYRRTYVLQDTLHGWQTPHYTIPDILPGAMVDSRLILSDYDREDATAEQVDAVARLSYYLGVAAHMSWGPNESGAMTRRLVDPLKRAFGLKYVHHLDSYKYDPAAYRDYLAHEIMAGRPVYYAGYLMATGGHAFVLDGLDDNGLFHVNWAYGGDYDGYYRLDVLFHSQPESDRLDHYDEGGFFCNQEALTLCPDEAPDAVVPDSLERTGREIVIEGMEAGAQPLTGCYTPIYLYVRNTSDRALTTPFALLANLPSDTLRDKQADWLAYTGTTLSPGARDTLCVHTLFKRSGRTLLSVTPDGEERIDSLWIDVRTGGTSGLTADEPRLSYPDSTTVRIEQRLSNPLAGERAAQDFFYDLRDDTAGSDRSLRHYIYLAAGADTLDTAEFHDLMPGHTYTLRLRSHWPIVRSLTFTLPEAVGVDEALVDTAAKGEVAWYDTAGHRVSRPGAPGVYLRRQGTQTTKYLHKR